MTMHQTLSEFMGCKDWGNDELCGLIDKQHDDIKARDELIRDMRSVIEAFCDSYLCESCPVLGDGVPCRFGEVDGRRKALGIEVHDD